MKKLFLLLLVSLCFTHAAFSQTIVYGNLKEILPFLEQEDYKGAYEKTDQLLKATVNDSSALRGIVTYMNIYSAAGMVSLDQMSYGKFKKVTEKFIGQFLIMPAHPCIDSTVNAYNSLQFVTNKDGKLEGMTMTSNSARTCILSFEYFDYTDPIVPADLIGKNVRCGGVLDSLETSPTKSKIWIVRLRLSHAMAIME